MNKGVIAAGHYYAEYQKEKVEADRLKLLCAKLTAEMDAVKADYTKKVTDLIASLHRLAHLEQHAKNVAVLLERLTAERDEFKDKLNATSTQVDPVKVALIDERDQLKAECERLKADMGKWTPKNIIAERDELKAECARLKEDIRRRNPTL